MTGSKRRKYTASWRVASIHCKWDVQGANEVGTDVGRERDSMQGRMC